MPVIVFNFCVTMTTSCQTKVVFESGQENSGDVNVDSGAKDYTVTVSYKSFATVYHRKSVEKELVYILVTVEKIFHKEVPVPQP